MHKATVLSAHQDYTPWSEDHFQQQFNDVLCQFDRFHQCVILHACENDWLTCVPTAQKDHFDLTLQEFRDTIAVHYK